MKSWQIVSLAYDIKQKLTNEENYNKNTAQENQKGHQK